jgi:hypothetical protein
MRYILHIGLNKTGTSTLQVYLHNHRAELQAQGVWYPSMGKSANAQHDLAQGIKEKDFSKYGIDPGVLKESGAPEGTKTILICSENFHTVKDVPAVAALFPPEQTKVIIYLREHVAYLASWYQQVVQTRGDITYSFFDFAQLLGYPFMDLVGRWKSIYGENVHVRAYDRDKLVGGDIVVDFFAAAFGTKPPSPRHFEDKNPSISGNLLFVKLVLNHFLTMEESQAIIEELGALAVMDKRFTGKMRVSELDAKRLVHRYREDRKQLRESFGIMLKPPREGLDGNAAPDMATLRDDVAFFLSTAKARNFRFHDTFSRNRDLFFPPFA